MNVEDHNQSFDCPTCGQAVEGDELVGERGDQTATCKGCGAQYARTFALYEGEWVFGLWRNRETGKVACSLYKTAFGTDANDC